MNRSLLRTVLAVDAVTCSATGVLLTATADVLAEPLGLPAALLKGAGLSLFPFAAFLAYLTRRSELSPAPVWFVIALNVLWVLDSALLFAWTAPTALGAA